ncbi:MAG: helical backbone metal receptor [Planctomycetota bacterium]
MRIVSLCPSLTELVFDLGCGDALVGRTAWCCHPRGAVERVEAVGGTKTPDLARILALRPDLVLMNDEENRREDWEALRAAGLNVYSSLPVTAADTAEMVRAIGTALAAPAADVAGRAHAIAEDIERRAARVAAAAQQRATPVRFAYLIWREPWMGVGADTYASALLTLAGGLNVLGENAAAAPDPAPRPTPPRYPQLTPAALADAQPDLVLLGSEPFPFRERHLTELAALTGLPAARFRLVDGELLSWHGSRTPAGIDYAESLVREALLRFTPREA